MRNSAEDLEYNINEYNNILNAAGVYKKLYIKSISKYDHIKCGGCCAKSGYCTWSTPVMCREASSSGSCG